LKLLKKYILNPLFKTIDDDKYGAMVMGIFLLEIIIGLIIPWFFNWKLGLKILLLFIFLIIFIFIMSELSIYKKINKWLSFLVVIPMLLLLLFPTIILTIFMKKSEKNKTILELRIAKLNKLKRKLKIKRFKFWNNG
jgi:hypothetical protein